MEIEQQIISIYNDYNKIHSVRNSFYKFIEEMPNDSREKLFDSIRVRRILKMGSINEDGTSTSGLSEEINVDPSVKKQFLFKTRNLFTHNGISFASNAHGIPEFDKFRHIQEGFECIYSDLENKREYWVQKWPAVLVESVKQTLNGLSNSSK